MYTAANWRKSVESIQKTFWFYTAISCPSFAILYQHATFHTTGYPLLVQHSPQSLIHIWIQYWSWSFSTFVQIIPLYNGIEHYYNKCGIFTLLKICILLSSLFSPTHQEIIDLSLSVWCSFLHDVTIWVHAVVCSLITMTSFAHFLSPKGW